MTEGELKAAIEKLPHERVTLADIEKRIAKTQYIRIGETVTLCNMTLDNGYSVRGESACVDPGNYSQQIGEKLARDQAIAKLWTLFGFMLAEARHLRPGRVGLEPQS